MNSRNCLVAASFGLVAASCCLVAASFTRRTRLTRHRLYVRLLGKAATRQQEAATQRGSRGQEPVSDILQHTATNCNTLQRTATHYNTLYHTATHCHTQEVKSLSLTFCNTLQRTATHCNTLQHTLESSVRLADKPHTPHRRQCDAAS